MEWKKEILRIALAAPNHAVDRYELRCQIHSLAEAEGVKHEAIIARLARAIWTLRKEGVIVCDTDKLTVVDLNAAQAKVDSSNRVPVSEGGQWSPCRDDNCKRGVWAAGFCYPCACKRYEMGVLEVTLKGEPLNACSTNECGTLAYRAGLCNVHENQKRRREEQQKLKCRDCETKSRWRWGRCEECWDAHQVERESGASIAHSHYDWVVVHRFWTCRPVPRSLTRAERVEVARLILRSNKTLDELAYITGRSRGLLCTIRDRYGDQARKIGLEEPLRFCFLTESQLPSDAVLAA